MASTSTKYNFIGKVALVTGSSSGIGAAIAVQFARYGAYVTITGRNEAALKAVENEIENVSSAQTASDSSSLPTKKVLSIIGDLLDDHLPAKLIEQTVASFGRLDFLVNNAGGATPNGMFASEGLLQEYDRVMQLNVRSVMRFTQLAAPHLEKSKGNIINISSIAAISPFQPVYSISKAALDMVTKTSALELGPRGIRVNSINPGPVVTDFLRSRDVAKDDRDRYYQTLEQNSLMKRIGVPNDIANLASFLASDDAINITGSIMVSDSGTLISAKTGTFRPNMYGKKE